jgi:hypothetical protein
MSVAHDWRLGPYTVDDFDDPVRFPPDEGTYEMRDGWVLISPWHDLVHEITVLRLIGTTYVAHATARAGETLSVSEPFAVQIDVSGLTDQ